MDEEADEIPNFRSSDKEGTGVHSKRVFSDCGQERPAHSQWKEALVTVKVLVYLRQGVSPKGAVGGQVGAVLADCGPKK